MGFTGLMDRLKHKLTKKLCLPLSHLYGDKKEDIIEDFPDIEKLKMF